MELKLLLGFVASMLGSLFGKMLIPDQAPSAKVREPVKPLVIAERKVSRSELKVPSFVTNALDGHYVGVSVPYNSISEARNSAIADVVRQVLSAVSIEYRHRYLDRVSGNPNERIMRTVDDRLMKVACGVVLGVERNIVKSFWARDGSGKYVYFVLVKYPDKLVSKMRRLSKGAKIIASILSMKDRNIRLKISEVNGVEVILSAADVKIRKRNKFARVITLFLWRVPSESEQNYPVYLDPVKVCGNSKIVELSLEKSREKLADYLLGARYERAAVLKGHDEIGRPINLRVSF